MDRFIRRHSEQELGNHAWQLAQRASVVFSPDGLGPSAIVPLPGATPDPPLTAAIKRLIDLGKEPPHRWLMDRTHLRLRASGRARSHLRIWIRGERLYTTPTVSFLVDGQLVGKAMPDRTGMLVIDGEARCTGWCEGYILISTISEWWQGAQSLQIARLLDFEWDDLP